jgi:hypothetical protein
MSEERELPKLEVKGFVGYIKYIAYLGTYEEYMRQINRGLQNDGLVKNKDKERKQLSRYLRHGEHRL